MALKDLACDLVAGRSNPGNVGLSAIKVDNPPIDSGTNLAKMCKEVKWVGAPDPTDDLNTGWRGNPCKDDSNTMGMSIPFAWWFVFNVLMWGYLVFNVYSFSVELAKAPADDTEMGKKPAVAVATATAAA